MVGDEPGVQRARAQGAHLQRFQHQPQAEPSLCPGPPPAAPLQPHARRWTWSWLLTGSPGTPTSPRWPTRPWKRASAKKSILLAALKQQIEGTATELVLGSIAVRGCVTVLWACQMRRTGQSSARFGQVVLPGASPFEWGHRGEGRSSMHHPSTLGSCLMPPSKGPPGLFLSPPPKDAPRLAYGYHSPLVTLAPRGPGVPFGPSGPRLP